MDVGLPGSRVEKQSILDAGLNFFRARITPAREINADYVRLFKIRQGYLNNIT